MPRASFRGVRTRTPLALIAPLLCASILASPGGALAASEDSAGATPRTGDPSQSITAAGERPAPALRFGRADLWFAAGTVAALAATSVQDRWLTGEAIEARGPAARSLARFSEHLGNPLVMGPALIAADLAGRAIHRPGVSAVSERIALSTVVAGTLALGLKQAVGRERPSESPGDARVLRPFSGADAFPSGHATVAFALATALDLETRARWVPWVAYPAAAAVGWSRVRDQRHWTSDVVAGAALGAWTAAKVDRFARTRLPHGFALGLGPRGVSAALSF